MTEAARTTWWARLAIAAALVAAVVGIARGLSLAPDAQDRLRDDAFYEFTWAANVAAGLGPVVSDGVTTSGVQLLWSLCLVPVAWLGGAASLPVVAPWLGLLLHVATACAWLLGGRDRLAALCLALCWLGNPLLLRECQNGQETALATGLLVVLWLQRAAPERRFLGLSLLLGLARTDLVAVVLALSLWRHRRAPWRGLLVPFVVAAVQMAAARCLGGGWLPDSGAPMAWLWHSNFAATEPTWSQWWSRQWWFTRPVLLGGPFAVASAMGWGLAVFAVVRPWWPLAWRALPALLVGCASASGVRDLMPAGWAALLLALWPAARPQRLPSALLALCLGVGAVVALHWAVRWYPRDYYVAPLVVGAMAALRHHAAARLLLLTFAVAQLADARRVGPEPLRGQLEMQMGGRFLAEVLPAGEAVGCFNSGLVGFEAAVLAAGSDRQRRVVNLDGVVDARSLRALQERRLGAWLDELDVRFVLDNPVQFASDPQLPHACGRWFGPDFRAERDLVEVARFDLPGVDNGRPGGDSFRLYWRAGRGALPAPPTAARDLGPGPRGGRYVLWPARAGQWLDAEVAASLSIPLVSVDADTAAVVFVAREHLGTGRLFVRGQPDPVLVLPRL